MTNETASAGPRLRVDWTIPFWGVLGLAGQALVIAWWGATIQERVDALERWTNANSLMPATVARLDERSAAQSETLRRVEEQLARMDAGRRAR
jgi:hypothetical protein